MKMKWINLLALAAFLFSHPAFSASENVTEKMMVETLFWSPEDEEYRVQFQGRAGAYFSPKERQGCLLTSLRENKKVSVEFNPRNLKIKECKVL